MKKNFRTGSCSVHGLCALCAGGGDKDPKTTDNGNETAMKVVMITDYGDITDQSFNQTTYEACKAYCSEKASTSTTSSPLPTPTLTALQ